MLLRCQGCVTEDKRPTYIFWIALPRGNLPKEYGIASQMEQFIIKMHLYVLVFCVLFKLNGRESHNND